MTKKILMRDELKILSLLIETENMSSIKRDTVRLRSRCTFDLQLARRKYLEFNKNFGLKKCEFDQKHTLTANFPYNPAPKNITIKSSSYPYQYIEKESVTHMPLPFIQRLDRNFQKFNSLSFPSTVLNSAFITITILIFIYFSVKLYLSPLLFSNLFFYIIFKNRSSDQIILYTSFMLLLFLLVFFILINLEFKNKNLDKKAILINAAPTPQMQLQEEETFKILMIYTEIRDNLEPNKVDKGIIHINNPIRDAFKGRIRSPDSLKDIEAKTYGSTAEYNKLFRQYETNKIFAINEDLKNLKDKDDKEALNSAIRFFEENFLPMLLKTQFESLHKNGIEMKMAFMKENKEEGKSGEKTETENKIFPLSMALITYQKFINYMKDYKLPIYLVFRLKYKEIERLPKLFCSLKDEVSSYLEKEEEKDKYKKNFEEINKDSNEIILMKNVNKEDIETIEKMINEKKKNKGKKESKEKEKSKEREGEIPFLFTKVITKVAEPGPAPLCFKFILNFESLKKVEEKRKEMDYPFKNDIKSIDTTYDDYPIKEQAAIFIGLNVLEAILLKDKDSGKLMPSGLPQSIEVIKINSEGDVSDKSKGGADYKGKDLIIEFKSYQPIDKDLRGEELRKEIDDTMSYAQNQLRSSLKKFGDRLGIGIKLIIPVSLKTEREIRANRISHK
ncbi:MAG: hypothetical protein ACTSO2_20380 [Promethearchaeota archaeon]